ncbi:MAG: ABC transporter permease [Cyclobacteriaceae bacterium]
MNFTENIKEGIRSIHSNRLRTVLTASIVAIGITSLVGILTAIDGIQSSIDDSFSNLGTHTFRIRSYRNNSGSRAGKEEKNIRPLEWQDVDTFKERYTGDGVVTLNSWVTFTAEVKYGSEVTNPNTRVKAGDENLLSVEGYNIDRGRDFSGIEIQNAANVALIGSEISSQLFSNKVNPINKSITFLGAKFRVVGVMEEQGGLGGDSGPDRTIIIPMETGRKLSPFDLNYEIKVMTDAPMNQDYVVGETTGLMRKIRQDDAGRPDSFEVRVNKSLSERLDEMSGYLRIGGFSIGFITLLGASIALMNIMMVSVTERTREIGVRKALGATPLKIRRQFLIESIVICQLGGFGGIFLGLVIGNVITAIVGGSFIVPWLWIFISILIGMVVGVISGYIPAYQASKLDPIESLRFE